MGCDIHLFIEKKTEAGWEHCSAPPTWNHWEMRHEERREGEWEFNGNWYSGRNYEMFALLAGVRNSHDQKPIAEPRGMPRNASLAVRRESKEWGSDGHSHSHLTLAELEAGLQGAMIRFGGRMPPSTYEAWEGDFPSEWYASCSGRVTISEAQYLAGQRPEREFDIECSWELPADKAFEHFSKLLPELRKLGAPDEVRLVFWFDN